MKTMLSLILVVGLAGVGFAEFDVDPTNPDSLLSLVEGTQKTLEKAQAALIKTLSQEAWENESDFAKRKVKALVDGNEEIRNAQEALKQIVDMVTFSTWHVDDKKVSVSVGAFDKNAKEWKVTIASSDPAVPFSGSLVYNIANSKDLPADYKAFDAAIKAKSVLGRVEYKIGILGENNFRVRELKVKIALSLEALEGEGLASASQSQRWDFVLGKRQKPTKTKLLEMVSVSGGTFMIGSDDIIDFGAKPTHKVTVSGFKMSKTEVTQAFYEQIMGKNPSYFKGENNPVESISWYDAIEFCNKLSELEGLTPAYIISKTKKDPNNKSSSDDVKWTVSLNPKGNGYRLPTEAQWEFAARGGTRSKGYTYAGNNDIDEVAWYSDNSDSKTHEVATKTANELGLYDMSGNVWEWCWDWYEAYTAKAQTDPLGAVSGNSRGVRGGCYGYEWFYARVALRDRYYPLHTLNNLGFRVLLP